MRNVELFRWEKRQLKMADSGIESGVFCDAIQLEGEDNGLM